MSIKRLNPDTLHQNPAFTQVVTVENPRKLIYVGGQNGVNTTGEVVGQDIASQSEQAFKNVIMALEAAGATLADVVKMTIYVVQGQSLQAGFAGAQKVGNMNTYPPAISVIIVAGLANPQFLVEIEAVAAIV
ncbi:MAG: RidA family protein [Chloroflexi bacterium]|nr:RidA family protein [Chloroflexota bacterium]